MQARLGALSWVLGSQECIWSLAVATKGHAPEGCPQDLLHQYSPFEVGLCLGKDTPGYHPVLVPKYLAVAFGLWHERLDQMQGSFPGSWICPKQYQVQEYISVSFSGWDLNTSDAKASGTMGVK